MIRKDKNGDKVLILSGYNAYSNQSTIDSYMDDTLFRFESQTIDSDDRIRSNNVVKIIHHSSSTYLSTMNTSMKRDAKQVQNKKKKGEIFTQMLSSCIDDDVKKYMILMEQSHKDEDAFVFEHTGATLFHGTATISKKDMYMLHSSIAVIKEYVAILRLFDKEVVENRLDKTQLKKIEQQLIQIIFFITKTEDTNPYTCEGIPYPTR